jgi:hypothetical protein
MDMQTDQSMFIWRHTPLGCRVRADRPVVKEAEEMTVEQATMTRAQAVANEATMTASDQQKPGIKLGMLSWIESEGRVHAFPPSNNAKPNNQPSSKPIMSNNASLILHIQNGIDKLFFLIILLPSLIPSSLNTCWS